MAAAHRGEHGLDSIEARHVQVEHGYVEVKRLAELDGLDDVGGDGLAVA